MNGYNLEKYNNWLKNSCDIKNPKYVDKLSESLQYLVSFAKNFNCSDDNILEITSSKDFEIIIEKIKPKNVFTIKDKINHFIYSKTLDFYLKYLYYQEDLKDDSLHDENENCLEGNRNRKKLKSAHAYINKKLEIDDLDKMIIIVLETKFTNGLNLNSIINVRRFTNELCILFPDKYFGDHEIVKERVRNNAINCHDSIYMARKNVIPTSLLEEILTFVLETLLCGRRMVYIENIYVKFREKLLYTNIHDKTILNNIIMHYLGNDVIYNKGVIYFDVETKITVDEEILELLFSSDMPLSKDYICGELPHILPKKIEMFLKADLRTIYISQGVYWHIDRFDVSQEDKYLLEDIVKYEIQNGFISAKKLLEILKIQAPSFIKKNAIVNYVCLKDILKFYFSDVFGFKFTFIGKQDEEMSGVVATRKFISDKESFTLTDFMDFISENELPTLYGLFFNEISIFFMRIDKEQFLLRKNFICNPIIIEKIEETVDKYLENGYIAISKIDSFSIFPAINYKWNSYILKSILENFSKKYDILDFSNSTSKPTGIIVSKISPFKNYDEVIEDVLLKHDKQYPFTSKDDAMKFLFSNGYLAQKRYRNAEAIFVTVKKRNLQLESLG